MKSKFEYVWYVHIFLHLTLVSTFYLYTITSCYFREGNGTLLQYSCLENPMDRGAWGAAVHGVAKSRA